MRHSHLIFGIVLLGSSWFSAALTLGPVRGEALIGQPLNVTVSVQTDPTEDASALCWSADLLSAETRQSISQVRVLVEAKGRTSAATLVRVVSAGAVDEPIVTLNLSAGCQQKTTRHYVLLADLPSTPAPAALITTPAPSAQPKRVTPAAAPAFTKSTPAQTGAPRPAPAKPKAPARTEPPSTQPRLQLEALDELSDRVAEVNLPMTFAPSVDALHQAQALEALQQEVAALRALEARNEASITSLKHRLQVLESRREQEESSSVWLLWLGALALLSAIAWWWQQRTSATTSAADLWWRSLKAASTTPTPTTPTPAPAPAPTSPADATTTPQPLSPLPPLPTPAPAAPSDKPLTDFGPVLPLDIDIDLRELHELSESNFNQFMEPQVSQVALARPSASLSPAGAPGHLSLEALFDIRQQAEFFISLGQTNQAIELLKKSIQQGEEHNPFIYLDLLGIFHTNALLGEFGLLRDDCNLLFNVKVPEFALFEAPGCDLLDYPKLLGGICAAWRSPDILQVLESLIFRDPWDATKGQTVDLAAFRDLLWLHQVAQTLSHKPRADDDKPWAMSCPAVLS